MHSLSRREALLGSLVLASAAPLRAAAAAVDPLAPVPFRIDIPQARLDDIRARLQVAHWPDEPHTPDQAKDAWRYGPPVAAMKELVGYWLNTYDWRKQEAMMNRFPHFKANIAGQEIHFIHERGSGKNPQPIILLHGWPSSFVVYLEVIDRLAHPERHGGKVEDAFTVVVPDLPGFGFSGKPQGPLSDATIARALDVLMVDRLGYKGYIAQGHDFGAGLSVKMQSESPFCKAAHINLLLGVGRPPVSDEEREAQAEWDRRVPTMHGYRMIQSSKPLSLAYGMTDSPLAVAAWLFEKYQGWPELAEDGDPWKVLTREQVLNEIMVYLANDTFGTASWMYITARNAPGLPEVLPARRPALEKPVVGVAHHPGEKSMWPRSYAERVYQLVRWNDLPRGGHFPAWEQPDLYVEEMRSFSRLLKQKKL